jgi:hypothetical protein
MINMASIAVVASFLMWAGLIWFLKPRFSRGNLQSQFAAPIEPAGPFIECNIRFVPDEMHTRCIALATPAGLYMSSPPQALAEPSSIFRSYDSNLIEPVLIPWSVIEYGPAKFPLWGSTRFDVPSANVTFFVRRKAATELLRQACQPLPSP